MASRRQAILDELKALVRLAAPVAAVQLGLMLMGVVDTIMVGHYAPEGLAAVALGNVYHWGLLVFGQGILLALDPLVAQAYGAGDREAIALWFQRGLVLAIALSIPFFFAFQFSGPILLALGQPPSIVPVAASFVRATALGLPAFFVFTVLRQTLQAVNVVRPIVIAVVVGNIVNLFFDWVLVYGHLGFPPLGAPGAGWATTGSRYLVTAILAVAAAPQLGSAVSGHRSLQKLLQLHPYWQMLAIGIPIGFQYGLESWVFLTVSLIMGWLGPTVLAGHQIAINLASLSFMVPLGIGAAAAVRVGNAIGRGDLDGARRAARVALVTGASVMTVSACAFALFPRLLALIYSPDSAIIESAAVLLPIAALFQIFDGTQAVGCGVLRGSADTRAAAIINFIGYWILGLPIGLALAFPGGMGPRGLWWGLTIGLAIVAVLLVLRITRRVDAIHRVAE